MLIVVLFSVSGWVYGQEPSTVVSRPVEQLVAGQLFAGQLPEGMKLIADRQGASVRILPEDIARIIAQNYRRSVGASASEYPQGNADSAVDSITLATLHFRVNSIVLEPNYMDNAYALDMIRRVFSDADLLEAMDFITITAAASPEGYTANNERLAEGRALAVKQWLTGEFPNMDHDRIFTFSIGEDWNGLRQMVWDDERVPYRTEVLAVLDSGESGEAKRAALRRIGSGVAYDYLLEHHLPELRGAAAFMIYYKPTPVVPVPEPMVFTEYEYMTDTVYVDRTIRVDSIIRVPVPVPAEEKPYYWSVKTNLLYDLALLPDLHFEFSLGKRFSLELGGQWSWWTSNISHDYCERIQIGGLEFRLWLGNRDKRTPLSGHFLGLYGMGGTYDVRWDAGTGYLSNLSYSAGLSYGYSARLSRSFNLEFALSVGYMGGEYQTYHIYDAPQNIFYRDARFNRHYIGPTAARVSLVWLLGGKNEDMKSSADRRAARVTSRQNKADKKASRDKNVVRIDRRQ
jgi:hypothetical protein